MKILYLLAVLMLAVVPISLAQDQPVDYESFDPAVLVILADNMVAKLDELDAKHDRMIGHMDTEQPAEEAAGEEADEAADADAAQAAEPPPSTNPLLDKKESPHAKLDKAALVARCKELEGLIVAKETQIAEASGAMGERFGGEVATVGDDSIYIEDGEWVVTVIENREPDPTPLKEKIAEYDKELSAVRPQMEQAVESARNELTYADAALSSAESHYDRMHEKRTVYRTLQSGHKVQDSEYVWPEHKRKSASKSKREASKRQKAAEKSLKTAERKLNAAVKKRDVQVNRLEREIEAMLRARELVVELDNDGGKAIVLATQAYVETASTMQPESRYTVRGKGRFVPSGDEPGRITMKEAEPAQ